MVDSIVDTFVAYFGSSADGNKLALREARATA